MPELDALRARLNLDRENQMCQRDSLDWKTGVSRGTSHSTQMDSSCLDRTNRWNVRPCVWELLQTHINFPRFLPDFSWFSRVTFTFSPYLLAPITRDHQMLKSPHSLDSLTSWVTCVLLCTSCSPHVGLTDHTWHTAFHIFASCLPHVCSLASPFPHG
jgi:hypothetical protein